MVSNEDAKQRLIKLGEYEDKIFVTGCPSIDLAKEVSEKPELDFDPCEKYGGVGQYINTNDPYLVVMQHPVTTEFNEVKQQVEILIKVISELNIPTFWFWPNPDAGSDGTSNALRTFREENPNNKFRFFKNMEGKDFLKLLFHSKCLIGNSSVGIRECSFLGVPVVNIGTRQNRRVRGLNVKDVDFDEVKLFEVINLQLKSNNVKQEEIYGNGDAGFKIAEVISKAKLEIKKVISY